MTKLEQIQSLVNAVKSIELATKSLQFACNTLLEVTKDLSKPELHIIDKEKE